MTLAELSLLRRVRVLLQPWDRAGPGMTVGVVRGGALVLHESAGLASLELGVPIGADTCFRIASVSKQFTCAAIMRLAAEGRLSPTDPVHAHLPELPDFGTPITLDHLMHNSSGLRDMLEIQRQGGVDLGLSVTPEQLMAGINRQRTLNFAPGSRFMYSNTNFLLLGLVVERVAGEPLGAFLQRRIFAPLGMSRTRHTPDPRSPVPGLATGYLPGAEGFARASHGFPLGGEGGLVSCVEDLALWDAHCATGAEDALQAAERFPNGRTNLYLRGLRADTHRGVATISHGGLWPGFRTEFLRVPGLDATVIAITNDGASDPAAFAHAVLDLLLDGRPGVPPPPATPEAADLHGRWVEPVAGLTMDIAADARGLTATVGGAVCHPHVGADGRFAVTHGTILLQIERLGADALRVEQDAGHVADWHRAPADPALPPDLPGTYRSAEMAAEWRLGDGTVRVDGPRLVGTDWVVEPVEGDLVRIWVPGALGRQWFDARLERGADGAIAALLVNSNRLRGVRYTRA